MGRFVHSAGRPLTTILGTEKTKEMLAQFYGIKEGVRVVRDDEELSLGSKSLKFIETPFVHWPETMMTYEETEKILFSGDAFGGFGSLDGGIFDDQVDLDYYQSEILRYFSNIIGMYTITTQRALQKLKELKVKIVAPTHGPVWRSQPRMIIDLYDRWSKMEGEPGIVLIYGSMYGNTERMVEAVAEGVTSAGCKNLRVFDASRVHLSFLLTEAWRCRGVIIAAPTYDGGIFLPVEQFVRLLSRKKLKDRVSGIFGSYGWGGGAVKQIRSMVEELNWKVVEPVIQFKGRATEEKLKEGEQLGRAVAEKILQEE